MYPEPEQPPAYVLSHHEPISDERQRFTENWLTKEEGLEADPFSTRTSPLWSRHTQEDDDWRPPDLTFLLLRCQVGAKIREDPNLRKDLSKKLEELKETYKKSTLVIDRVVEPDNGRSADP